MASQVQDASEAVAQAAPPDEDSLLVKQKLHAQKRIAIAADALTTAANVAVPTIPKTEATRSLIGAHAGNRTNDGQRRAPRDAIPTGPLSQGPGLPPGYWF